jgi:hypothetical protein
VIVFVETTLDVIEAVSFARHNSLPIAVQATGHGVIRKADGAMLINTSRMQELRIDPAAQTAGVKWGKVLDLAQRYGLAPLLGSSPDVGAVGYSLGGGMGWLARKYGMSADSVLRLEVVTPDGVFRAASPDENSDLFWALRGGGGGFGVVTGMEIQLHPVTQVYAGNLFYPAEMAREVFSRFSQWTAHAPDELTTSIVLINFPPIAQLPPVLSGKSFVIVRGCYAGPLENGEKLLEFWRAWKRPNIDDFKPIPFSEAASISQDPIEPLPNRLSGAWLKDLSDETADTLIHYTLPQGRPPVLMFTEVRLAGGAIARVEPERNAYCNRDERYIWGSIGVPMNAEMAEALDRHLKELRSALTPSLTGKVYMNFVEGEEARERTREGFDEQKLRRLQAIKAQYDPDNLMCHSYDIAPVK